MRYEAEIKELLIENAIHLIAEGGFEKATTKELTHCGGQLPDFKMNEVYIYRFFKSKENLYEAAFVRLDTELFYAFKHGVEIVGGFDDVGKEKLSDFSLWLGGLSWAMKIVAVVTSDIIIQFTSRGIPV